MINKRAGLVFIEFVRKLCDENPKKALFYIYEGAEIFYLRGDLLCFESYCESNEFSPIINKIWRAYNTLILLDHQCSNPQTVKDAISDLRNALREGRKNVTPFEYAEEIEECYATVEYYISKISEYECNDILGALLKCKENDYTYLITAAKLMTTGINIDNHTLPVPEYNIIRWIEEHANGRR